MRGRWLLLLDLDGTLWDHHDISSLTPPFKRVDKLAIADSRNTRVSVRRDIIELLVEARKLGGIVASFSWNEPGIALDALHVLGLDGLFDYHLIEPHPGKHMVLSRFLEWLRRCRRLSLQGECIVYVDDRTIHLDEIARVARGLHYIDPHDCAGRACKYVLLDVARKCGVPETIVSG